MTLVVTFVVAKSVGKDDVIFCLGGTVAPVVVLFVDKESVVKAFVVKPPVSVAVPPALTAEAVDNTVVEATVVPIVGGVGVGAPVTVTFTVDSSPESAQ